MLNINQRKSRLKIILDHSRFIKSQLQILNLEKKSGPFQIYWADIAWQKLNYRTFPVDRQPKSVSAMYYGLAVLSIVWSRASYCHTRLRWNNMNTRHQKANVWFISSKPSYVLFIWNCYFLCIKLLICRIEHMLPLNCK